MGLGLLSGADWGKVGGKVGGRKKGTWELWPPGASTPKTFPRQTTAVPRHGDSAAAPPNQAKIWTAGTFQRRPLLTRCCSPPGTPPAETLNTKPYRGGHAKLPAQVASPVSGALFGAFRGSTPPPSHCSLVRPCDYRRIGRASHTSSLATPCLGGLGPRGPHGGKWSALFRDGSRVVNCRHEAHARLPDPILQIFNSRLVGLGKCRMNQVSSQVGPDV